MEMHKLVWEQYAAAEYSWQPFGDTATRRGFYDAWMLGAVPIISTSSAEIYRRLFNHAVLGHLKNYVLVAPPRVFEDGATFIRWVMERDPVMVQEKREKMRQIAPILQYGWESEGDALTAAFGVMRAMATQAGYSQEVDDDAESDLSDDSSSDMEGEDLASHLPQWAPMRESRELDEISGGKGRHTKKLAQSKKGKEEKRVPASDRSHKSGVRATQRIQPATRGMSWRRVRRGRRRMAGAAALR